MRRTKCVRLYFAGSILGPVMERFHCWGITMPWRIAYIGRHRHPQVIRHELVHLAQIRRDGDVKFWAAYLYHSLVSGYARNPYEIEADRIAGTAHWRA